MLNRSRLRGGDRNRHHGGADLDGCRLREGVDFSEVLKFGFYSCKKVDFSEVLRLYSTSVKKSRRYRGVDRGYLRGRLHRGVKLVFYTRGQVDVTEASMLDGCRLCGRTDIQRGWGLRSTVVEKSTSRRRRCLAGVDFVEGPASQSG
jgi:hypothetical protein